MEEKSKFWNEAGKAGLVIAVVAIAYFVLNALLAKWHAGFISGLLSFVLWAGKMALCIILMVKYLRTYAEAHDKDRTRTFRYGMAVAACSALVYSAYFLFHVLVINPDMFAESFNNIAQMYSSMLTTEQMDSMLNMESSLPTVTFFVNLVWCWLFGTIVAAVASSRICNPDNPFVD